jgi:hypothetical protein
MFRFFGAFSSNYSYIFMLLTGFLSTSFLIFFSVESECTERQTEGVGKGEGEREIGPTFNGNLG